MLPQTPLSLFRRIINRKPPYVIDQKPFFRSYYTQNKGKQAPANLASLLRTWGFFTLNSRALEVGSDIGINASFMTMAGARATAVEQDKAIIDDQANFFRSCLVVKERQANTHLASLRNWGLFPLLNSRVLDVGSGIGINASFMTMAGARVTAVEPDKAAFGFSIREGNIKGKAAYNSTVQDLPEHLNGTFDLVVIFGFCIPLVEREAVFERISRLLTPGGKLIITTEHKEYFSFRECGDNVSSLRPVLLKYFAESNRYNNVGDTAYAYALISSKPLQPVLEKDPTDLASISWTPH